MAESEDPVPVSASCPRCQRPDSASRFYGPCPDCRAELVARFAAHASAQPAGRESYQPRMHVTPNFVATGD